MLLELLVVQVVVEDYQAHAPDYVEDVEIQTEYSVGEEGPGAPDEEIEPEAAIKITCRCNRGTRDCFFVLLHIFVRDCEELDNHIEEEYELTKH